ncbi:MAG: hypothetical protein ABIO72_02775 [Patescibacteria group bacterium]
MENEATLKDVIGSVHEVMGAVQDLATNMQDLATHMDERFEKVDRRFENIDRRFEKIESTMATKDELKQLENRVITEIDHFVTLHTKHDHEIVALRSRCDRIETSIAGT